MVDPEIAESDLFFDTKSKEIVKEPPEEGVLICRKGDEITQSIQVSIDQYSEPAPVDVVPESVTDPEPPKPAKGK